MYLVLAIHQTTSQQPLGENRSTGNFIIEIRFTLPKPPRMYALPTVRISTNRWRGRDGSTHKYLSQRNELVAAAWSFLGAERLRLWLRSQFTACIDYRYGALESRPILSHSAANAKYIYREAKSRAIIEVQSYLEHDVLPQQINPLQCWREHKYNYPHLSVLVQEKCCTLSTSVPFERLFSKAGMILNDRRTRLSGKNTKCLLFLNSNSYLLKK